MGQRSKSSIVILLLSLCIEQFVLTNITGAQSFRKPMMDYAQGEKLMMSILGHDRRMIQKRVDNEVRYTLYIGGSDAAFVNFEGSMGIEEVSYGTWAIDKRQPLYKDAMLMLKSVVEPLCKTNSEGSAKVIESFINYARKNPTEPQNLTIGSCRVTLLPKVVSYIVTLQAQ